MSSPIYLVASGDLRLSANQVCWAAQVAVEALVIKAIEANGGSVIRAHAYDAEKEHGFIDSQKMGMEVFREIPSSAPVIVVEAVWQYSHHVLAGLTTHEGPILTIANWSGQWPGLVGLLNLNASLRKAGIAFSSLWSEDFSDDFFQNGLNRWLSGEQLKHDESHVRPYDVSNELGQRIGEEIRRDKTIMGVFDEGCMGMYNAIIPDELLHATGVFKERLSQSALVAAMNFVKDQEAQGVYDWLSLRGMTFNLGKNEATDLTENQILQQCKMYIAAVRIADDFGCEAIGIQYQQGLKDMCPASDLVEGMLNSPDRPPVFSGSRELFPNQAVTHFNEVDECAGLDAIVTNRIWTAMGLDPSNTLHDLRYGEQYGDDYVWVLLISGAAPASHFIGGYQGAFGDRQPPMYFPLGGSTMRGISRPGEIVWSRIYVAEGRLKADMGRATVIELPEAETQRRWQMTTPQWPIMHTVLHGVSRDQMMARHMSNHIQVAYGGDDALAAKAAAFNAMGIEVFLCGV
ncbi:MAG: fucose isomerase [Fimbriimonadaceae bacterium]